MQCNIPVVICAVLRYAGDRFLIRFSSYTYLYMYNYLHTYSSEINIYSINIIFIYPMNSYGRQYEVNVRET